MRKSLALLLGALLLGLQLLAQNRTVSGRVTDERGTGIPNVSVTVRGTGTGTTTGPDGSFTLSVPTSTRTLTVSAVDYEQQEVTLGNDATVTVALRNRENALNEVVVTGYGRQRRSQ